MSNLLIKNPDGAFWRLAGFPSEQWAIFEQDHLVLLTGRGYSDIIRRIYFDRIEAVYCRTRRRPPDGFMVAISVLMGNLGALEMIIMNHLPRYLIWVVVSLLVVCVPPTVFWLIHWARNPTHWLYIIRQGRTYVIKSSLSERKFSEFYGLLRQRIRERQGRSDSIDSPVQQSSTFRQPSQPPARTGLSR